MAGPQSRNVKKATAKAMQTGKMQVQVKVQVQKDREKESKRTREIGNKRTGG